MVLRTVIRLIWLFLFGLILFPSSVYASHIAGGEISYEYLGGNKYKITLKFYRDCSGISFRNPADIVIYNSSGTVVQTISVPLGPVVSLPANPPSPCTSIPSGICIEMATYTATVTLPPIPGGYQIVHEDIARNSGILNGPAGASAYSATIPDISLAATNSNPKFNNLPPIFICAGAPFTYDNSATDTDSDSLVYSLCSPLESAVPYIPFPFTPPYSATNPMGGSISINAATGLLVGTSNTIGKFVVGVCVTEYRKGKLISSTTRDFQFNVVNCVGLSVASALSALTNCNTHEVTFFNNSIGATSYLWKFGDGQTSTLPSPVHVYAALGTYTTTLIAYTGNPLCADSIKITVKVGVCLPCGMSLSAATTSADCAAGGCGKITWTVPCSSCTNLVVNICGSYVGSSSSTCSSGGGSSSTGTACPSAVTCGGVAIDQIPGATSTFVAGGPCTCTGTIGGTTTNKTISYCTNKPQTLGTATITVTGGTGPYTYGWSPSGGTGATAIGLAVGVYTVIVTDANGCVEIKSVPIGGIGSITINMGKTDITACGLTNGTATATPSNGTGTYTYLWAPGGQTTSSISGLAAGTYTVIVNDASNCPTTKTVTINPVATINVNIVVNNASCSNSSDGSAVATGSGGASPYTYSWNTTPGQTTSTASGLPKGFYMVQVTDANGCTGTQAITINAPAAITLVMGKLSPTCFSAKNGTATATVSGGTPGYVYQWGANAATQTTATITGLIGGETYAVTITDSKNCTTKGSIFVDRPNAINHDIMDQSTVSCSGTFSGKAQDIVSGGTPGYTYNWSPGGATSALASNLTPGVKYTVTIKDANNCSVVDTITVFNKGPLSITATSTKTCGSSNSGTATVVPTGGNTPYTYLWNPGAVASPTLVGLASGSTYTVTVTDGNGCTKTSSVTIGSIPALVLSKTVSGCTNNASIDLTVSGGAAPYIYNWLSGQTTEDIANLSPNTYKITVWDVNNCFDTLSVVVQPSACNPTVQVIGDSICPGGCKLLTASGNQGKPPYTFLWNPGAVTGNTLNVCSGTSQIYTVTITDAAGATSADTALVAFRVSPVINVSPATICAGSSAVLIANGAATYVWSPATGLNSTTGTSVTANPAATTTYTITGTTSAGCVASTTVDVQVNNAPIVTVADANICPGGSATLTANGAATYTWAPATGLSSTTGSTVTANPASNTTYTVTGTSSGCDGTTTVTVSVGAIIANAGPDASICSGQTTSLNASGGSSYSWSPAGGLSSASVSNPVASPLLTTTYTVTATSLSCTAIDSVTITVNPLPTVSASGATICEGSSAVLNATGADTYLWSPTTGLSTSTGGTVTANPIVTITYTVTGTFTPSNCFRSTTVLVTVNPVPVITASPDSLCEGSSVTLTANGANTYSWTPATGLSATSGSSVTASPLTTTTYFITGTTLAGCTGTKSIPVKVFPLPTSTAANGGPYCEGDIISLTSSGGDNYAWSGPNGYSSTNQNPVLNSSTVVMGGIYTVTVSSIGCTTTSVATTTVIVNPSPKPTASNTGSYCPGQTISLNANGGTTYSWTGPNGFSDATQNPTLPSATPVNSGVYSVTATAAGCSTTVVTNVIVYPIVVNSLNPHICPGQNYTLPDGTIVNTSGTYNDTLVSTMSGCDSIVVTALTVNTPTANAGNDVTIVNTFSTQLNATGGATYSWTPPDGLSCTDCPNPVASPGDTITYYLTTTDANGCTAMDSVKVNVKEYVPCNGNADMSTIIPNAFTPNGDGWNDLLCIPENICIESIELKIFDRWGEKVYDSSNPTDCWDGIYRGKELNTSVFAYYITIKYPSGKTDSGKGNISLVR